MTYKQQLTDFLCTEKSVDEQIKELKFGTKVILKDYFGEKIVFGFCENNILVNEPFNVKIDRYNGIEEIIGNPIKYHHLMMYGNSYKPKLNISIDNNGYFWIGASVVTQFDVTKPLSEQSEEVYEKILIALNGLNL